MSQEKTQTKQMKGVLLEKYGDNSVLNYTDIEIPKIINPKEVLIQVYSASINPHDISVRKGEAKLVFSYVLPIIVGYDISGVIVDVGKEVTKFKKGDEVFSVGQTGAFAEFAVVPDATCAFKPKNLTHDEAASLPMVGLTTIQVFQDFKAIEGSKIFITGGAGGIGTFATQYATNILKCDVTTTASEKKHEICKKLGAKTVIDYHKEDFRKICKDFDFVYDTTHEIEKCFSILKPKGMARTITVIPDGSVVYNLQELGLKGQSSLTPTLLNVFSSKTRLLGWWNNVDYKCILMLPNQDQLTNLSNWVEEGKIKPVIDQIFDLKDIKDAYSYMEKGRATGKVIIHIHDEKKE